MISVTVSNQAELLSAINAAVGDTTIVLKPANYGDLFLDGAIVPVLNSNAHLTLTSADANNPAVVSGLDVLNAKNLAFDGLEFDYVSLPKADVGHRPFTISDSNGVDVINSTFNGDLAHSTSITTDGFGTGLALSINRVDNLAVTNNVFVDFHKAVVVQDSKHVEVTRNDISKMASDGINFKSVQHLLIEENHIHDFAAHPSTGAHKDMIQFWTNNSIFPTTDVVIRKNILDSGKGVYSHTILAGNNLGPEYDFQRFLIEDNFIHNAFTHGVSIFGIDGLTIRNNTIIQNPDSAPDGAKMYIPKIHVDPAATNVVVENNIVAGIAAKNAIVSNNLLVQNINPNGANYYGDIFENGLMASDGSLQDFAAVQGGIIEKMQVGADLTQLSNVTIRSLPMVPSSPPPAPSNIDPTAQDDYVNTVVGTRVSIDVLANDADHDGGLLILQSVGNPTNGTARIGPNNTIIYTPDPGYTGSEVFSYRISDGNGGFDNGKIHVDVSVPQDSKNSDPQASDDLITTAFGRSVKVNVLSNDYDADNNTLTTSIVQGAENGTVSLSQDGFLRYTPLNGFSGTDQITYLVDDGSGGQDTAMVYVTVQSRKLLDQMPGDQLVELTSLSDNVRFFNRETDNVSGLGGDDHIRTTGGADVIDAGAGNDILRAGNGDDLLLGGTGNDKLFGGNGQDIFYGGEGQDIMRGNYQDKLFSDKFVFTSEDLGWVDRIVDFGVGEGDQIDVSSIFEGKGLTKANAVNYLQLKPSDEGTLLSYDIDGKGNFSGLVEIDGTSRLSLQGLLEDNALIIS